jgi:endoglucanase
VKTLTHALIVIAALVCASAPGAAASGGQNPGARDPNPLVGQSWWDQHTKWNETWKGYRKALHGGRGEHAAKILRLARTPQFRWWGQWERPIVSKLRGTFALMDEQAPGLVPLMAVHGLDHSACGPGFTAGGPAADDRYRRWILGVAEGIGDREAVIAYEPDSLGTIECLTSNRRGARMRLLAYGVKVLSELPNVTVYIDAGAPDWQGVPTIARKLKAVGVGRVRGFMLNATHQATTRSNIRYGLSLSRRLGGKHFIVNTSHNGNGPDTRLSYGSRWCNPPNEAAGALPTTHTANSMVDAYLWVERPGFSNGTCNGGPTTGHWWEERAVQMVDRARW